MTRNIYACTLYCVSLNHTKRAVLSRECHYNRLKKSEDKSVNFYEGGALFRLALAAWLDVVSNPFPEHGDIPNARS